MGRVEDLLFKEDEDFELDMAPFLGLMATLIPMLLLATAFLKITILGAKVPVIAEAQTAIDKAKEDSKRKKIKLHVRMTQNRTVSVAVKRGGRTLSKYRVPASTVDGKVDSEKLTQEFIKIKKRHPNVFQARINPTEVVKYEDIVAVMDTMRVAPGKVEFPIKDKDTGEVFQTNIMFDQITFGNIMGDDE